MVWAKLPHISNNAHDLAPRTALGSGPDMFAQRILILKELMNESSINHSYLGSALAVLLSEEATRYQGNAQSSEVAWAYYVTRDIRAQPGWRFRLPFDIGPPKKSPSDGGESTASVGGLDGGQRPCTFEKLLVEGSLLLRFGVLVSGQ